MIGSKLGKKERKINWVKTLLVGLALSCVGTALLALLVGGSIFYYLPFVFALVFIGVVLSELLFVGISRSKIVKYVFYILVVLYIAYYVYAFIALK